MQLGGCVLIFHHLTQLGIPSLNTQVEIMLTCTDRNLNSAQTVAILPANTFRNLNSAQADSNSARKRL
jgi:hypothetical protein